MAVLEERGMGKALLAGGYTVLERPNVGLVLGLPVEVRVRGAARGGGSGALELTVHSLALAEVYSFAARVEEEGVLVAQTAGPHNAFVLHAVRETLGAVAAFEGGVAVFEVVSDGRFHGATETAREGVPPLQDDSEDALFARVLAAKGRPAEARAKTGLGSSAALTAALVKALVGIFDPEGRVDGHKVAQKAHCAAQGKVGSGFDVCAAFAGSARYVRFTPARLGETGPLDLQVDTRPLLPLQHCCVVVGGVPHAGSSTRSMVRAVMQWRETNGRTWDALCAANAAVDIACGRLCALAASDSI